MRTLGLFSGIGGLDLGLERAGFQIVAQCEQDPFCRAVLAKHWPGVPCFDDVRTIDPSSVPGVECVCGGFPCQDVSVAGKGAGVDAGERSGLWREMFRVIDALRPRWVLAENVPALRTRGADRVLGDLERIGYTCTPLVVGAGDVGAPHRRQRVFIVAHAERDGRRARGGVAGDEGGTRGGRGESAGGGELGDTRRSGCEERHAPALAARAGLGGGERDEVADADGGRHDGRARLPGRGEVGRTAADWPSPPGCPQKPWEAPRILELPVGPATDGVSPRLVRFANRCALKATGNAVVPQDAEVVGAAMIQANREMCR